jgi:predicted RNA-binding protein with PUA-like domain
VKEAYPDPSDPAGRFVMVDVAPIKPVAKFVTLAAMKAEPALADLALIRQSRLSVVPICDAHWGQILAMAAA